MKNRPSEFELLETMRWENGVQLLERHLERLQAASGALGFEFNEQKVRSTIGNYDQILSPNLVYRLRFTMSREGTCRVTFAPIPDEFPFVRVVVNTYGTDTSESSRKYKTTRREVYESVYREAREEGYDEAIITNRQGNVAEGTRTNVWALIDGVWTTPPLSAGCLGGVYRAHMLDTRTNTTVSELSVEDLCGAEQVALSNAVHGLVVIQLDCGDPRVRR